MHPKTLDGNDDNNDSESIDLNKFSGQNLMRGSGDSRIIYRNGDGDVERDREYSYDEAMEIAGTGWYTNGLLLVLCLSLLAMSIDIHSFSTVVALSSCDFYLTNTQTNVLLSIPFIGPVIMAYIWGYVSDTQGRRKSLLIAMSLSFILSVICAFSPNWIALAVFKVIACGFSSCAQAITYVLLGESCCERLKYTYLLILASAMHVSMSIYLSLAYAISKMDFEFNMGTIIFVPWRLLIIILALPLGISALGLSFFYESPKFLLSSGQMKQALDVMTKIYVRNRGINAAFPVQNVVLNEDGNIIQKNSTILGSLWQQTAPLFQPPLLHRTVLLCCLIFIIHSSSSSILVWLPFLADDFNDAVKSAGDDRRGICSVISKGEYEGFSDQVECTSKIPGKVVMFGVSVGITYSIINIIMSKFSSRKKVLIIATFVISGGCCIGAMHIPNNLVDIIMFFGSMAVILCTGIAFAYCVDMYPTSYRGMATCVCVLVAQVSSIFGINFIGSYITWHCIRAFFALAGLIFCGAILSYLLPSDNSKKQ